MIDKATEERATLFVLDLLDEGERRVFEEEIEGSGELKELVRELTESLYAPQRAGRSPDRPDLLNGILERVQPTPAPAAEGSLTRPAINRNQATGLPWAWIFGAAAVLLLGMNFVLLTLMREQSVLIRPDSGGESPNAAVGGPDAELSGEADPQALEARIERLQRDLERKEAELAVLQSEKGRMEARIAEVREFNTGWQLEYARLAARLLPFYEPNDGMSRFTVIEMVDAEAFAQQLPRRGFADLAGRFLAGEGNIAGTGSGEFVGPVVEGAGVLSATLDPDAAGLNPLAGEPGSFSGESLAAQDSGDAAPADSGEPETAGRPTGFTVWNDNEQKGFLDLYNLPEAGEGLERYLWVRSSELDPYLPVGTLPDLDGGTGSVFYSVEEETFTPSEILITAEPVDGVGDEPSGTIILRGP